MAVTVYLTDEGSDGTAYDPGNPAAAIGADDAEHETGGEPFTEEEILKLCKARGKNKNGDTLDLKADKNQLAALNEAKKAGKTGVFEMAFSMEDGTKVQVRVTLTGKHLVIFDPDGGNYTPEIQTVEGGNRLVRPKEPKKDGYEFVGWFYTDENGTEKEWDFKTPVHEGMTLRAKWKKPAEKQTQPGGGKKEQGGDSKKDSAKETKKKNPPDWEYSKRNGSASKTNAAKTSDRRPVQGMLLLTAASMAGFVILTKKKAK